MSPQALAERYVRRSLHESSKVAALILRHCPEFIVNQRPDETVDRYVRRIGLGTIRDEAVEFITSGAGPDDTRPKVNGSCLIRNLKSWQRHALADRLDEFAREVQA